MRTKLLSIFMVVAFSAAALTVFVLVQRRNTPDDKLFADLRRTDGDNSDAIDRLRACGSSAAPYVPEIIDAVRVNPRIAPWVIPILDKLDAGWPARPEARTTANEFVSNPPDESSSIRGAAAFVGRVRPDAKSKLLERLLVPNVRADATFAYLDAVDSTWPSSTEAKALVPKLIRAITDDSTQTAAAAALNRITPGWPSSIADEFVPAMVEVWLYDPKPNEPWFPERTSFPARRKLTQMTLDWHQLPVARRVIPSLVLGLFHPFPDIQQQATKALDKIDPAWERSAEARSALPLLLAKFGRIPSDRLAYAEKLLDQFDPEWLSRPEAKQAIPGLIRELDAPASGHVVDREHIKRVLGQLGPATPAEARELATILNADTLPEASKLVFVHLHLLGNRAAPAVPVLVEKLSSTNAELVVNVLDVLKAIDPNWAQSEEAKAQVPVLTERFTKLPRTASFDRSPPDVLAAAEALVTVSPEWATTPAAKDAIPDILQLIGFRYIHIESQWPLRAAPLLDRLDPDWRTSPAGIEAVRWLVARIAGPPTAGASTAEVILRTIDPKWPKLRAARAAIPDLVHTLASTNELQVFAARAVLNRIDPDWMNAAEMKNALPKLRGAVVEGYLHSRAKALALLDTLEPGWAKTEEGRATVARLIDRVTEPAIPDRPDTLKTLDKVDPKWHTRDAAKARMSNLIYQLALPDTTTRSNALVLLKRIDSDWMRSRAVKDALPRIIGLLNQKGKADVRAAVEALEQIGPAAKDAVPKLKALLKTETDLRGDIEAALKAIESDE